LKSLCSDPKAASNPEIDPHGIQLAKQRDKEIESGKVQPADNANSDGAPVAGLK
jgi:hypothetical protein